MDLGSRIRQARLEEELSQSQLCENLISRNMLSLIENGSANPSLSTLAALAERLHRPVGYFFGENSDDLTGRSLVEEAWAAYRLGDMPEAARILDRCRNLDRFQDVPVLKTLVLLSLAEKAIEEKRFPYAGELLHWIPREEREFPELRRRILLLQGKLQNQQAEPLCRELPSLDGELLLRARGALEQKNADRAAQLLEAAEDRDSPDWAMLRGRVYLLQGHYRSAARCFHQAEQSFPREVCPLLEQCYRELKDFKQAYCYACKQKGVL